MMLIGGQDKGRRKGIGNEMAKGGKREGRRRQSGMRAVLWADFEWLGKQRSPLGIL